MQSSLIQVFPYCTLIVVAWLIGNFDKFQSLISSLNKPFSAIGVSEIWLNDLTCDSVNISGYNFISNHRSTKTGGGLGIYLQDFLQYKLLHNCN